MGLANSGAVWTELPGTGVAPAAARGVIVDRGGGVYEITATGTAAASPVSDGLGGYEITTGVTTGTGVLAFLGANAIIY